MHNSNVLSIITAIIISVGLTTGCGLEQATPDDVSGDTSSDAPMGDSSDTSNDDPAEGETDGEPECLSELDCHALEACVEGSCEIRNECVVDEDCAEGESCDDAGACQPGSEPDPECAEDADCGEGRVCTDGGTCEDAPAEEPECAIDADCADGEVCNDAGSCEAAPEPAQAPVAASSGTDSEGAYCTLHFGIDYVSMATCGEARGNMPGMSWGAGIEISDMDGDTADLELTLDADAAVSGTYDMSYLGWQSCGAPTEEAWAQYGGPDQLAAMTADAREFISCNWWDADAGEEIAVDSYSCGIKVNLSVLTHGDGSKECMFMPAGNMRDYAGE